mmetsp:Transcript_16003/g.28748  ORF Transcript_16003/g.28748 Transcript_16003/m.28748 type:complete len:314 (+) Transcript_16003:1239-2180(+)
MRRRNNARGIDVYTCMPPCCPPYSSFSPTPSMRHIAWSYGNDGGGAYWRRRRQHFPYVSPYYLRRRRCSRRRRWTRRSNGSMSLRSCDYGSTWGRYGIIIVISHVVFGGGGANVGNTRVHWGSAVAANVSRGFQHQRAELTNDAGRQPHAPRRPAAGRTVSYERLDVLLYVRYDVRMSQNFVGRGAIPSVDLKHCHNRATQLHGACGRQRNAVAADHFQYQLGQVLRQKGGMACHKLVDHTPQGPHVTLVRVWLLLEDLRGHVKWSANGGLSHIGRTIQAFGQAKVTKHGAATRQKDVLCLHITMQDALAMGV